MFVTKRFAWGVGLLSLFLLIPSPAMAQAGARPGDAVPGADAVRFRATVVPLAPTDWGKDLAIPSGRAQVGTQLNHHLSVHLAGLRLVPRHYSLSAAVLGVGYAWPSGRVRVGPFLELGYGEIRAYRDQTVFEYLDEYGTVQQRVYPAYRASRAFGVGAGVGAEWPLSGPLSLSLSAGWWRFKDSGIGIDNLFVGLGLGWGIRDEAWYWSKSGRDGEGPELVIANARSDTVEAFDPRLGPVVIEAFDHSGFQSIRVDDHLVRFHPIPDRVGSFSGRGQAVVARARPRVRPGEAGRMRIVAIDGSGNRSETTIPVLGPPVDRDPPMIVLQPDSVVAVRTGSRASVTGYVADQSPMALVRVGGVDADLRAPDTPPDGVPEGYQVAGFSVPVSVEPGENSIPVVAVDTAGHRSVVRQLMVLRHSEDPELTVIYPTDGMELTEGEVTVLGRVVHPFPLGTVTVEAIVADVREAEDARIPGAPDMRTYVFEAVARLSPGENYIAVVARDQAGFRAATVIRVVRVEPDGG